MASTMPTAGGAPAADCARPASPVRAVTKIAASSLIETLARYVVNGDVMDRMPELSRSARVQREAGDSRRDVEFDRPLNRQRLQDDRPARAADQGVDADAGTQCNIAARAH